MPGLGNGLSSRAWRLDCRPGAYLIVSDVAGSDGLAAASAPSGVVAVALCGQPREVDSRLDLELCEHLPQMRIHCVRRYKEPLGDLAVCEAVGHELSGGQL